MTNKLKSLLEVEPAYELVFTGPFNQVVATHMKLLNPSDKKVCFKVKTTAPRRYCVRPNNGILLPKSSVDIRIRLQPLDIPDAEATKHKFMVQSIIIPEGHQNNVDDLWKMATDQDIMYSKLRCSFEYPAGCKLAPEAINRTTATVNTLRPQSIEEKEKSVADEEARRLLADVEYLRQENIKLKAAQTRLKNLNALPAHCDGSPTSPVSLYPSIIYVVFALLIGYLIGKFIV